MDEHDTAVLTGCVAACAAVVALMAVLRIVARLHFALPLQLDDYAMTAATVSDSQPGRDRPH